jgi:hypothetical protein
MFYKKLYCDITIRFVTITFQICIPYCVTPCIFLTGVVSSLYLELNMLNPEAAYTDSLM